MASQTQVIIDEGVVAISPYKTYGTRNQLTLNSMFPKSPIVLGDITTLDRTETYQTILDSNVCESFESAGSIVAAGSGLGLDSFYTNFSEGSLESEKAPDVAANTETSDGKQFGDGEGAPTTAYIPPLTSPGPESVDAADQPPFDMTNGTLPLEGNEFGSGFGATANPSETSAKIEQQTLSSLGAYISGRSFENSDSTG